MTREELKAQIDELMRKYADEEIDGAILLLIPVRHLDSTSSVGCFRLSPECRARI